MVFMEKYDIYNDPQSVFTTVSSLQDSHRCRIKKEAARNFVESWIEKLRKLLKFYCSILIIYKLLSSTVWETRPNEKIDFSYFFSIL